VSTLLCKFLRENSSSGFIKMKSLECLMVIVVTVVGCTGIRLYEECTDHFDLKKIYPGFTG
jgi:hypothetical protein